MGRRRDSVGDLSSVLASRFFLFFYSRSTSLLRHRGLFFPSLQFCQFFTGEQLFYSLLLLFLREIVFFWVFWPPPFTPLDPSSRARFLLDPLPVRKLLLRFSILVEEASLLCPPFYGLPNPAPLSNLRLHPYPSGLRTFFFCVVGGGPSCASSVLPRSP